MVKILCRKCPCLKLSIALVYAGHGRQVSAAQLSPAVTQLHSYSSFTQMLIITSHYDYPIRALLSVGSAFKYSWLSLCPYLFFYFAAA